MDKLLSGREVSLNLIGKLKKRILKLKCEGITPSAAFIRIGSHRDDITYQNSSGYRTYSSWYRSNH